jgi:hypothetical protein
MKKARESVLFSMISVPAGTGDICIAYDIPCGDDICLRHMKERISYHADAKRLYIMRRKPYIISRSDISFIPSCGGFIALNG